MCPGAKPTEWRVSGQASGLFLALIILYGPHFLPEFVKSIVRFKGLCGLGLEPDKKLLEGKPISVQKAPLSKSPWPAQPLRQLKLGWEAWE